MSAEKPYFGYYTYFPDTIIGSGERSFLTFRITNKQTNKLNFRSYYGFIQSCSKGIYSLP